MTAGLAAPFRIGPGLSRIRLPLPFPGLPPMNVYCFEEDDGSLTLVECGMPWDESVALLRSGLESLGHPVSDVRRLVVTHGHIDHWGNLPQLRELADFELVMHRDYGFEMTRFGDLDEVAERMRHLYVANGVPPEDAVEMTSPPAGVDIRQFFPAEDIVPERLVHDGDVLTLAGRDLRVVWTPGHAVGHACLFDPERGELFSGDHVLPKISPYIGYDGRVEDPLGDFLASLRKVEALDAGTTFPAHGPTLESGRRRAKEIRVHHDVRLGACRQALRHGPVTARSVMETIFRPNLLMFEQRLAISETLAHLEHLVRSGLASRAEREGVVHYSA